MELANYLAIRAEVLREAADAARDFADETENSHTWWVVSNWLRRMAEGEE